MSDQESQPAAAEKDQFPEALVRPTQGSGAAVFSGPTSLIWWLTGLCFLVAVTLVVMSLRSHGPEITVHFEQGYGIKAGDTLRHRGIDVGQVTSVQTRDDLKGVDVVIELEPTAVGLARQGSRFWIERPQVRLSRVSGLETVVGAKYIGVMPGPAGSASAEQFVGLESPPTIQEEGGLDITVHFQQAHGLVVGDVARYRGMAVGEVTRLELDDQLKQVAVGIRLVHSARRLAQAGSLFWVQRASVSLTGVSGLETLVGGHYVAVLPAPSEGKPLTFFQGLELPPASAEMDEGALEITLEASHRYGLRRGAPVSYRGLQVGRIVSVGLSTDSVVVEARAYVQPQYKQLIRDNSRFWSTSGVEVRIGFTGIELDADTLDTIAAGGVALATPETPGKPVNVGHRFVLYDEPQPAWLQWRPRIPIGTKILPEGLSLPSLRRARLIWKVKRLGLTISRQREGWVLPLSDGYLLGPADVLSVADDAIGKHAVLEVAGQSIGVVGRHPSGKNGLSRFKTQKPVGPSNRLWPIDRIRKTQIPEDCLLVADPKQRGLPVSAARLTRDKKSWHVDPSLPLSADWHGASVLARNDGALIGVLLCAEGPARVALLETPG